MILQFLCYIMVRRLKPLKKLVELQDCLFPIALGRPTALPRRHETIICAASCGTNTGEKFEKQLQLEKEEEMFFSLTLGAIWVETGCYRCNQSGGSHGQHDDGRKAR